jgi:hypothetical protein
MVTGVRMRFSQSRKIQEAIALRQATYGTSKLVALKEQAGDAPPGMADPQLRGQVQIDLRLIPAPAAAENLRPNKTEGEPARIDGVDHPRPRLHSDLIPHLLDDGRRGDLLAILDLTFFSQTAGRLFLKEIAFAWPSWRPGTVQCRRGKASCGSVAQ